MKLILVKNLPALRSALICIDALKAPALKVRPLSNPRPAPTPAASRPLSILTYL